MISHKQRLPPEVWTLRAQEHAALLAPYTDPFLLRRSSGAKHPVHDFLFTYYTFSPTKLKHWVPSYQYVLEMDPELRNEYFWFDDYWYTYQDKILTINPARLQKNLFQLVRFIGELCKNILERPPRFGCFGLHEWAMVYKLSQEELRHKDSPLRVTPKSLAQFVESQTLCCTHYDAYRFFTEQARPLNTTAPHLNTRLDMEQGGCIHANMDLYKWSTKLWPWIGSEFIAKTFLLAFDARELDMRASPYDLSKEGYPPIRIETDEGKKLYVEEQKLLTEKATTLRRELLHFCQTFCLEYM